MDSASASAFKIRDSFWPLAIRIADYLLPSGKSLGQAGEATLDKVYEEEKEKPSTEVNKENVVGAEFHDIDEE